MKKNNYYDIITKEVNIMKFLHTSDLHLGKKLYEYSLIDDQSYILAKIIEIAKENNVDALLISGDIYDHGIPSVEAQNLFEAFLLDLQKNSITTFIIKGNHDSNRLGYAKKFISAYNIFINEDLNNALTPVIYKDVNFYLLPFFNIYNARYVFPDEKITSIEEAYKLIIEKMQLDKKKINVLLAHDVFLPSEKGLQLGGSESVETGVGGLQRVGVNILHDFDYVALGHIHKPQTVYKNKVRYSGSPLKYSDKEAEIEKSVTIVNINPEKQVTLDIVPLTPVRDLVKVRGTAAELLQQTISDKYVAIELADKSPIVNAMSRLRVNYPYIINLFYKNIQKNTNIASLSKHNLDNLNPEELFDNFFQTQNGRAMSNEERDAINKIFISISEGAES